MAQRVTLNRTDDSILSSVQLHSQTDLLASTKIFGWGGETPFFVNGQHAQQCRLSSDRTSLISRWHHDFQLDLLSDWRNTICMKQSISQSLHSFYPIKDDSVQWGFYLPGRQMDLDKKPWQLCDCRLSPANCGWRLCDLSERVLMGVSQVTYMTVDRHYAPSNKPYTLFIWP